jgi:hypothetical protein
MLTVIVLVVLWLVVVVPMVVRRNDERSRDRSVEGFGRAMRLLARKPRTAGASAARTADPDDATYVMPRITAERAETFVARRDPEPALANRRPVPAAEEALMYPVDRNEMSEARRAMMARRRRSLTVLGLGSVLSLILAVAIGGAIWVLAVLFIAGLGGYLLFLRNQAMRDRERRASRQIRSASRRPRDREASELAGVADESEFEQDDLQPAEVRAPMAARVRIDDDDIELHTLDTVDLTGLYEEGRDENPLTQRRAG